MALGTGKSCLLETIIFTLNNHKLPFLTLKYELRIQFKKIFPRLVHYHIRFYCKLLKTWVTMSKEKLTIIKSFWKLNPNIILSYSPRLRTNNFSQFNRTAIEFSRIIKSYFCVTLVNELKIKLV